MALHGELKVPVSDDHNPEYDPSTAITPLVVSFAPLIFDANQEKEESPQTIYRNQHYANIHTDLKQHHYATLDDHYRMNTDAEFNISRSLQENKQYPAGAVVVRDAKDAKKLGDPSIDRFRIEANNTILRVLGRLRSIDYVLMKQIKESGQSPHTPPAQLRESLKTQFDILEKQVNQLHNNRHLHKPISLKDYIKRLNQWEKAFNTETLCQTLITANLSEGCASTKDFEKLLFHYRNLSALLDPAKPVVTETKMTIGEREILITRREEPVTQKLQKQKDLIQQEMSDTLIFPAEEQETFHTTQNRATQIANKHFAPLAASDNRMFAAQSRKAMLHTVRNTWRTSIKVTFPNGKEHTYQFMRSGTATYVGKGESKERILAATKDNKDQIHQFLQDKTIHWVGLVTDGLGLIDTTKQKVMVENTKLATEEDKRTRDGLTIASTNLEGLTNEIDLSEKMNALFTTLNSQIDKTRQIGDKAERVRQIAKILIETMKQDPQNALAIILFWCASGQDRTGTAGEFSVQRIIEYFCEQEGIKITDEVKQLIEAVSIESQHTAMLTSCLIGGSDGCKNDSHAKGLLSADSDAELYLKSADTNKKNKVDTALLRKINVPSKIAITLYQNEKENLRNALFPVPIDGIPQTESVRTKLNDSAFSVSLSCPFDEEKTTCTDLYLMTEALSIINRFIKVESAYKNKRDERCDYERLQHIRKAMKKQSHLKYTSKLIRQFLYEKAILDLRNQLPKFFYEKPKNKELEDIALKILSPILNDKKVKVSNLNLFYEGIEIISDLMRGPQSYIERYGDKGLDCYDRDIKKLQIIQEKLNQWSNWKKAAGLFMDFTGIATVVGVITVAALAVIAAPVTGGSSLLALTAAVHTLAMTIQALNTLHLTLSLAGSAIVGCTALLFGRKILVTHAATRAFTSSVGEVVEKVNTARPQ